MLNVKSNDIKYFPSYDLPSKLTTNSMLPSTQYFAANSTADWSASLKLVTSPASFSGRHLLASSLKVAYWDRHLTDRLSTH